MSTFDVLSRAPKLTALLPGVSGLAQLVGGDGEVELVGGVPLTECQPHCDPAHSALLSLHRESNKNFRRFKMSSTGIMKL